MYNLPFQLTKYTGAVLSYPAFSGWGLSCGVHCSANSGGITAFHGYPYFGQQEANAWTTLENLNSGIVEFSFGLASTYNAGAIQVVGTFVVVLWNNLIITNDSASVVTPDGIRRTVISNYNASSYLGVNKTINVKASNSELILIINGSQYYASYETLQGLSNSISFNVKCAGFYNGVHFAANSTLFAPGTIKITT